MCILLSVAVPVVAAGCVRQHTQPSELFQLSPESNANRAMQTRFFETTNDKELLSASAAALQDLGFQVEESVREVGFLRAAKERSAREYGQYLNQFFVWLLARSPDHAGRFASESSRHHRDASTEPRRLAARSSDHVLPGPVEGGGASRP